MLFLFINADFLIGHYVVGRSQWPRANEA